MSLGFVKFTYLYVLPSPSPSIVNECPLTLPSISTLIDMSVKITLYWVETHRKWDLVADNGTSFFRYASIHNIP